MLTEQPDAAARVTSSEPGERRAAGRRRPDGRRRRPALAGAGTCGYDRRAELTGPRAHALDELGVTGLRRSHARGTPRHDRPRSGARSTRLVEPLDAARAALHHDDDVRTGAPARDAAGAGAGALRAARAGPTGAGPAGTGRGWSAASAAAFRAAQPTADRDDGAPVPGRAGLSARRLRRLPAPRHVQPAAPGPAGLRRRARSRRRCAEVGEVLGPLGLPRQRTTASTGCPACSARRC